MNRAGDAPTVEGKQRGADGRRGSLTTNPGSTEVMKRLVIATVLFRPAGRCRPRFRPLRCPPGLVASPVSIPVTGAGGGAVFTGTFQLQKFATNAAGELVANGMLTGVVTTRDVHQRGPHAVSLPAAITQATCEILHLDLGPLSLDLLGLQIDLSRIVLDITAQPGPGNLLGNLLCGVANLLNTRQGCRSVQPDPRSARTVRRLRGAPGTQHSALSTPTARPTSARPSAPAIFCNRDQVPAPTHDALMILARHGDRMSRSVVLLKVVVACRAPSWKPRPCAIRRPRLGARSIPPARPPIDPAMTARVVARWPLMRQMVIFSTSAGAANQSAPRLRPCA